jgi:uncharacterized protein YcbK (DUF882 family)
VLRRRRRPGFSLLVAGSVALAYIAFLRPAQGLGVRTASTNDPAARPAASAFGKSGHVRMRFALPNTLVDYPLDRAREIGDLRYEWIPLFTDSLAEQPKSLANGILAPERPGFYRLQIRTDSSSRILDSLSLAVMVPFSQKTGASLNGYRIGFYNGERSSRLAVDAPAGFVQIDTADLELPVSDHLRLADFVTRDAQSTWPRYAAVDPRLLDKIELVLDEIESWYGGSRRANVAFDVHSGFRTPLHNRQVARSARDSRHQFGDAMDLAVDANLDGRVSVADTRLVALAVEIVERAHPELAGGMGIYTSSGSTYVHIDARGQRVRWRG